ncbi:hypothetical protein OGAPHI_003602 [Ogataea philodendri]|uniref:Arrestin C-terminal-like domain-containing protein n=1 Tax=Ogataea philodendri TaxID=1378263 RepID=A0A9P8T3Z5_9ASCO|nr:uncharacterized protein OGAPHI_003602 [Ogataea philodendri]KAH3665418.1 hypothetical protein OGAPHI_003602 [Ogataea philodendri]
MGKHPKKASKQTPLFDIRLHSTDKDVVVLKGVEEDAPSVLLSGVIALSVVEPITIKKLQLKLWATLKLNWDERYQTAKSSYTRPYKYSKILYEFDWDPLNLHDFLNNNHTSSPLSSSFNSHYSDGSHQNMGCTSPGFASGTILRSNNSSSNSLKMLNAHSKSSTNLNKNKSLTNMSSLSFTPANKNEPVVLQQGNYEFPFQTILDGSIPESIEGLPGCTLTYKIQSTIERGRFSNPIVTRRHIHVVRTFTTDAPELVETVAVENTWPNKVDYSISVPARAIAIGSTCPIDMTLVPLAKGLRLGSIKISLNENFSFSTTYANHLDERTVLTKTVPKLTTDQNGKDIWTESEMDENGVFFRNEEISLAQDKWEIRTSVNLPASLSKMTQDCSISHYVRVIHKLRFVVGLINTDGHVSELRATLPITLFISPFVPVKAKRRPDLDDDLASSNVEDATIRYKGDDILFEHDGAPFAGFSTGSTPGSTVLSTSAPVPAYNFNAQELMAPPNYENRVYDRLWNDTGSRTSTPGFSPPTTPQPLPESDPQSSNSSAAALSTGRGETLGEFNMIPSESGFSNHLFASLSQIQTPREGEGRQTPGTAPRGRPVFNLTDEGTDYFSYNSQAAHDDSTIAGPSFSGGAIQQPLATPGIAIQSHPVGSGILSPVQHLSRVNSFTEGSRPLDSPHGEEIKWDGNLLSRVPSYETAVKSEVNADDLTPAYEPSEYGSSINLDLLDSRLRNVRLAEGTTHQTSSSSLPAHPKLSRSNTSSSVLLHLGRHKDHKHLTAELAKSRASSKNPSPGTSRTQSFANLSSSRQGPPMGSGHTSPSSSNGLSPPKLAHHHSGSTSALYGSGSSNPPSSAHDSAPSFVTALKRPELVTSRSSSSFHLNMSKKNASLGSLNFLHKKKSTK